MFKNRWFVSLIALVSLMVAALTVESGIATSAVVSTGNDLSDYFQRHPGVTIRISPDATDWFERLPEIVHPTNAIDLSDYFQRHPIVMTPLDRRDDGQTSISRSSAGWIYRKDPATGRWYAEHYSITQDPVVDSQFEMQIDAEMDSVFMTGCTLVSSPASYECP